MKKKIIAILLLICVSVGSLSSCLMFDLNIDPAGSLSGPSGNTNINVEGGPNYENITINSTHNKNLLAASKAVLSSVSVICRYEEYKYSFTGVPTGTKETASAGSGVIYKLDKEKGDAYVITNYHVVYNARSTKADGISRNINLFLYGMENATEGDEVSYAIPATYVGGSMNYDIAVLKVTASKILMESNARAVDIADSDDVAILDTAIAIGNPGGGGLSATVGSVSVESEKIAIGFETSEGAVAVSLRVMRTDAAVNSGNSGGGLFNDTGELIGIVNAKSSSTEVDNIGYAIPSNVAKAIADNAIYYADGTIKRCMLGITVGVKKYSTDYNVETGKIRRLEEVVISKIEEGAAAAEYLNVGYVINSITVDGVTQEVTRIFHVVDSMLAARVGSAVTINITDTDGNTRDVSIPITENILTNY